MPAKQSEHAIQNAIRNALCDEGMFFRINVGTAWASNDIVKLADGSLLLRNPRPFSTGVPAGFHDLFGGVEVTITPDMVGSKVAVLTTIEVKSSKGKAREKQERFAETVAAMGGRTGFARTPEQAVSIARGES